MTNMDTAAAGGAATATTQTNSPAAGSPGLTTSAAQGTGAATAGQTSDWTTGLNDDIKGYVTTKGWKDPGSLADSYRNLEKLVGVKDKLIQLPVKDDDAAGWNDVYSKLGRPASPKDYRIEAPKEGGNPEFVNWAKNTFHEAGLTGKQAEALVAKWDAFTKNEVATKTQARAQEAEQQEAGLKKEWGMAYDQKVKEAQRAKLEFGIDDEKLDQLETVMGLQGVMKFLSTIGSKLGESQFVTGADKGNFGAMTPESARHEINSLRGDPEFSKRLVAGGAAEREKWDRLHKFAYPDA